MKTNIHFWSYLTEFFLEWEKFQTKFVEEIKTHVFYSLTFFRKWYNLWDNVGKYCRAGQATNDNMVHVNCMLDDQGYKHTLRLCNTHCFSSATMVVWMRLIVMLYIHCLSCWTCPWDLPVSPILPVLGLFSSSAGLSGIPDHLSLD